MICTELSTLPCTIYGSDENIYCFSCYISLAFLYVFKKPFAYGGRVGLGDYTILPGLNMCLFSSFDRVLDDEDGNIIYTSCQKSPICLF